VSRPKHPHQLASIVCVGWAVLAGGRATLALIDPERPASWLIGECKAIAALKVSAVGEGSAAFAVTGVLRGELGFRQLTIRWTATQRPPVREPMVGRPAVLLVPKDDEDPTLVQVSPEYLSLTPGRTRAGVYDFVRPNGFVKGSFNGEAADLIRLIEDTLARRAYFPIWADTSFAAARKIGDLPGAARSLAVGDVAGNGRLDVLAATAKGLVAFSPGAAGRFSVRAVKGIGAAALLELADADGDGRMDILTDKGLFLAKGDWRFTSAVGMAGRQWSTACFGCIPGRSAPAIVALQARRARLFARRTDRKWVEVSDEVGLDNGPGGLVAISPWATADRWGMVALTSKTLISMEATAGKPLVRVQSLPLVNRGGPRPTNPHIGQCDVDRDGIPDVFIAHDGGARLFRRRHDGTLAEVPDHLGDVRRMFRPVEGCAGLICEDFNNDGLADLLAWSNSQGISLVMNRGYHNLRGGTEIFDLPAALENLGGIQSVAAADVDEDGDLDLIVASGGGLFLLANTFEKKPEKANARPRNPLLTVRAPGQFGALITVEDAHSRPIVRRRVGFGAVAETVYLGYRAPAPATVVLTTVDGRTVRQTIRAGRSARPIVFR
jgi:hypothetical protein